MTKQQQANFLLVGFIGLLAIACVVALQLTKPPADQQSANGEGELANDQARYASATNFNFTMPSDWAHTARADKDIDTLTPDQMIPFGIVNDPTQEEIAYFSALATDPSDENKNLLSIYKYNTSNYQFDRIYKKSYSPENPATGLRVGAHTVWHAVGYDQGKLIVLAQDLDDSPGPCTEVYTLGRESDDIAREMLSLDLTDPYAKGLQPYRVPDDAYKAANEKQTACLEEMFP